MTIPSMITIPPGYADPDGVAGPVCIRQPVAWGELDALGHVNHTIFLRWLENARLAWFERVGIGALMRSAASLPGQTVGPILARIECDYRAPVGYPDVIWADARCLELGRSSLILTTRVWSEARAAIVAEGRVVVVLLDYAAGRSVAIPAAVRAAIEALDQPEIRGPESR
jgi:acyl-CoA thioester hydrolase